MTCKKVKKKTKIFHFLKFKTNIFAIKLFKNNNKNQSIKTINKLIIIYYALDHLVKDKNKVLK